MKKNNFFFNENFRKFFSKKKINFFQKKKNKFFLMKTVGKTPYQQSVV